MILKMKPLREVIIKVLKKQQIGIFVGTDQIQVRNMSC